MRVAVVSLAAQGGMHHYATELVNALSQSGQDDITLVLPLETDAVRVQRSVSIRKILAPRMRTFAVVTGPFSASRSLRVRIPSREITQFLGLNRVLEEIDPDVVHLNSGHVWYELLARGMSKKYCLAATLHDVTPHPGENSLRRRREAATLLRWADAVFVHTPELRAEALRVVASIRRRRTPPLIETVRHGDYGQFGTAEQGASAEYPTALFFGRMLAYKGIESLVRAFPLIRAEIPNFRLILAGAGADDRLRRFIRSEPEIDFRDGYVPDEAVPELFGRADLVVLPYAEASWSGVASLAAHFKRPLIAGNVGGLGEFVVQEKLGLTVPPNDPARLAAVIGQYFTNDALREELDRNIADRPSASWEEAANVMRSTYLQLCRS